MNQNTELSISRWRRVSKIAGARGRTSGTRRLLPLAVPLALLAVAPAPAAAAETTPPVGTVTRSRTTSAVIEPNVEVAKAWWTPQRGVWTPIGWKDHLFRFNVLYNGTLICEPAGGFVKPATARYMGRDLQLNFTPSADGALPPLPPAPTKLYRMDGGLGIQGWNRDRETPVLWTEWPCQEGVVMRQEIFAHMKGGGEVTTGTEPLYAWVRLSVSHVDEVRAPEKFAFGIQLSRVYARHIYPFAQDDSVALEANPAQVPLASPLTSETLSAGGRPQLRVLEKDGRVRLIAAPAEAGTVSFSETTSGSGVWHLKAELPVRQGAHVDLLVPMLPDAREEVERELALGFEGALAECETYWAKKPATAAVISTPEPYINEALARNLQFAQIIAERNPDNGEYSFLSGSYGYDVLWSTPTSMISHMFLDLLGYHDVVEKHVQLYKANQGTVTPPGPAYQRHPGYFSTPKTLTSFDWLTDHGAVLEILSRHALLSGDRRFINEWLEPILKGCEFIRDSCAVTGHGGIEGLMPPAKATDTGIPLQAVWNQAWTHKGLISAVKLLRELEHPRAGEFERVATSLRENFVRAFHTRMEKEPRWTDPQGVEHPVLPTNLIPPPAHHIFDDCFLLDGGPLVLPWSGLVDAADPAMRSFSDFFRVGPNTKLWGPRSSPIARAVLHHEISSCEPCYSWNIVNSWQTGDRAKFLEGMYALFTGAISNQTYINGEHRNAMYGTVFVAPLMTWCLRQAVIDDEIAPGDLHLLRLCPLAWLSRDQDTVFEKMPTVHGPVNLRFRLSGDGQKLQVSFAGQWRRKPGKVVLHIPPVPGLTTVSVNGTDQPATGSVELKAY